MRPSSRAPIAAYAAPRGLSPAERQRGTARRTEDEPLCAGPPLRRKHALKPRPQDNLTLAASLDVHPLALVVELVADVDLVLRPDDVIDRCGQDLRSPGTRDEWP